MRSEYLFNHNWHYAPHQLDSTTDDSEFVAVTIPHTNKLLPHNNFHDNEYQFISTYRKQFDLPEALNGRRLYLIFEGVMTAATVTINGHTFDEHKGGFVPFQYDITDYLHDNGSNRLTVMVDSHERADIPPHGGRVDYLVFGGIYRDVKLRYVETVHLQNVRVQHTDTQIFVDVWIQNQTHSAQQVNVVCQIAELGLNAELTCEAAANGTTQHILTLDYDAAQVTNWSLDNPQLYTISATLDNGDSYQTRFGFRTAEFRDDGFYLNGEKTFLRGLNRHQMYPYIGMAAPARLQARDADIIKNLGCQIVRTSHYPQDKAFLNRCDEIGLLVFEEIPGWQHIGDEDWQAISLRDVRVMIERDWNHPSIIVWGVRINESWDNTDFYTRTNALAREIDPTRPTSGVRFWPHSEFLEDVYGYNDFTNGVLEPTHTPWLITEFNGHMFPTKSFDNEERQSEHTLRHALIQDKALAMDGVAGAIGWCAFDYNTHRDFGSGDRVCYHGVLDMFRQPKWAGYLYQSQKAPQSEIVLHCATLWTMGDRSVGGVDPFYVLTNCDAVDVYIGGTLEGRYEPARDEFPHLPHPPIKVTGVGTDWGGEWEALRVIGLLNGESVIEQRISADGVPARLEFYAEDNELIADGMDMTRLIVRIVDDYGNRLPYAIQAVNFVLDGDAELIGENPFALVGGQAALFLKAQMTAGEVRVRASTTRVESVELVVNLHANTQDKQC